MKKSYCGKHSCTTSQTYFVNDTVDIHHNTKNYVSPFFLISAFSVCMIITLSWCGGSRLWGGESPAAQGPSYRSGCQWWGSSDSSGSVVLLVHLEMDKQRHRVFSSMFLSCDKAMLLLFNHILSCVGLIHWHVRLCGTSGASACDINVSCN